MDVTCFILKWPSSGTTTQLLQVLKIIFLFGQWPPVGQGLLIHDLSRSDTTTHHSQYDSSGRVISSSQRPVPDNKNTHNGQTKLQPASGRRRMPYTARPLGPAVKTITLHNLQNSQQFCSNPHNGH